MPNSPDELDELFEKFKREKEFLQGVSKKTIQAYNDAWSAFDRYGKKNLTEDGLKEFVIEMVKARMKPGGINTYSRNLNSFLTWLFENEKTQTHFKIKLQKTEKKVLASYSLEDMKKILAYKPRKQSEKRLIALLAFLLDSGCRINEAVSITRKQVDLENLLVTVNGKGNKQRKIPFSIECRKILFRQMNSHPYDLVFCARNGSKLRYCNLLRTLAEVLEKIGVQKVFGFHSVRRTFGKLYLASGGQLLHLQRLYGHESVEVTRRYISSDEAELVESHRIHSPLERVKR